MLKRMLLFTVLAVSFASAQTISPPVTPESGILHAPEGYYQWQYDIYTNTAVFVIESGLTQPGMHEFSFILPSQIIVREIHATHDYSPWCAGGGFQIMVQGSGPAPVGQSGFAHLLSDKFYTPSQGVTHTVYQADFSKTSAGGIPLTQVYFYYYEDGACLAVTSSWTVSMVIN